MRLSRLVSAREDDVEEEEPAENTYTWDEFEALTVRVVKDCELHFAVLTWKTLLYLSLLYRWRASEMSISQIYTSIYRMGAEWMRTVQLHMDSHFNRSSLPKGQSIARFSCNPFHVLVLNVAKISMNQRPRLENTKCQPDCEVVALANQ